MYIKKFSEWGVEKEKIHKFNISKFYPKQREIWYTKMGVNIGMEEDGKKSFLRPVLIIKKIGSLFLTVALTSKGKDDHFLYHKFLGVHFFREHQKNKNSSYAILSQIKVMDKKRFEENMGYISKEEFHMVQKKLKKIIF